MTAENKWPGSLMAVALPCLALPCLALPWLGLAWLGLAWLGSHDTCLPVGRVVFILLNSNRWLRGGRCGVQYLFAAMREGGDGKIVCYYSCSFLRI